MQILTYLVLTYLDKIHVTYGHQPCFDLVAERGCHSNHRLQLRANTPQRWRVVTIRDTPNFPLTDDPDRYP